MSTNSNNQIAQAINLYLKDNNLEVLLPSGSKTSKYTKIVEFLYKKRLLSKSKDILIELQKIIFKEHGVVEVKLSSSRKIKDKDREYIGGILKNKYNAKDIFWNEHIEESLLGGIKIEIEDEVIDLTLKNKIQKLQEHLTHSI